MILEFHWGNETIFLRNETICLNYFFVYLRYERTFCLPGRKTLHVGRKTPDAREKALHDGGISDDGEMGFTAFLWLGKDELTN